MTRFVDSNVFVYHLAADPRHGDRATKILASIEEGERGATSTLVVTQVCSYLKWKKREPVIPVYLSLLKKLTSLEKIETSILDFEQARGMQEGSGLDWRAWDDILIAAQMKRTRISEIYSNDADLIRYPESRGSSNRIVEYDGKATKNTQTNTVVSIWKGFDIVYQSNLGTSTVTKYFMANGLRIAEMIGSAVDYYHQDILGSTRLLSTSTSGTQFSSNYIPYGQNYGSAGTEVFQYTGEPEDSVTGYYNFGARYYDPSTGRFITEDSYSGDKEDPQSMTRPTTVTCGCYKRMDNIQQAE